MSKVGFKNEENRPSGSGGDSVTISSVLSKVHFDQELNLNFLLRNEDVVNYFLFLPPFLYS